MNEAVFNLYIHVLFLEYQHTSCLLFSLSSSSSFGLVRRLFPTATRERRSASGRRAEKAGATREREKEEADEARNQTGTRGTTTEKKTVESEADCQHEGRPAGLAEEGDEGKKRAAEGRRRNGEGEKEEKEEEGRGLKRERSTTKRADNRRFLTSRLRKTKKRINQDLQKVVIRALTSFPYSKRYIA